MGLGEDRSHGGRDHHNVRAVEDSHQWAHAVAGICTDGRRSTRDEDFGHGSHPDSRGDCNHLVEDHVARRVRRAGHGDGGTKENEIDRLARGAGNPVESSHPRLVRS